MSDALWLSFRSRKPYAQTSGVNDSWIVRCDAFGKGNHDNHPYLIANEWVAARLAQALCLPVPSFSLLRKKTGRTMMFASHSFQSTTPPSDVRPEICFNTHSFLCTGILVFDILIANSDRHRGNLKVDDPKNPKVIYIFDHDRSLFFCSPNHGKNRLSDVQNRLGITGGSVSDGNEHIFLSFEHKFEDLQNWCHRINSIPEWFIKDVCESTKGMGPTKSERERLRDFLLARKTNLGILMIEHKDQFVGHEKWGDRLLL
jgi:hypothetical protein